MTTDAPTPVTLLVRSHLGPNWYGNPSAHDDVTLLSLLDRVMETFECPPADAVNRVVMAAWDETTDETLPYARITGPFVWKSRLDALVRRHVTGPLPSQEQK